MLRILYALLLILFITSCSSPVTKDGPPDFYVDETKIPNAIPKPEPLAKYGNMRSYSVFGKRYYVLPSSKNYEAIGIASWYGTKFHSRRTSSGERYNLLGMTAAHRTLPLPTYVEVTNLANRKKIIVKVNDRGPFHSNRLIDLSYVAAKKLGMAGHGTAIVKVKAINPYLYHRSLWFAKQKPSAVQSWLGMQKQYVYLQVGAFHSRTNAIKFRQRLIALLSIPIKISLPARDKLYRVQIGPLKDQATANKISRQLRELGIKALVLIA